MTIVRAARWAAAPVAVLALLASSCAPARSSGAAEECTQELGIRIEPRAVTLSVGGEAAITVETSTCGGRIRGAPEALRIVSQDPSIARTDDDGRIRGIAPGETVLDIHARTFDEPAAVTVTVTP